MMQLRLIAGMAVGVGAALVALPTLYLARRLQYEGFQPERDRKPALLELQVTAVSDQTVTLRASTKKPAMAPNAPGQHLLEGARGWGYAGRVLESNGIIAVREYRPGSGDVRAGDYVRLDSYAHPIDPGLAHGLAFDEVSITSPLGEFPAWHVAGKGGTWAILTHGKGADRREGLRIMPALVDSGFHCLAITYRNDVGVPAAPRGVYSYGRDEWEELDGAVSYAIDHGAKDIVLVGFSMGGAITLKFMEKSEHAGRVSALILDAPMTHLGETVTHGAKALGLPVRLLGLSNRLAARRYGFDWADFDHLATAANLNVPTLLFHGDVDLTVPVHLSDGVAAARPETIQYVRVAEAGHVRSWNVNPGAYLDTVRDFVKTRRSVSTG